MDKQLLPYEKLFYDIQKIRDQVDHHDDFIPVVKELQNLSDKANELDKFFESQILPNLKKLGRTVQDKFLQEWEVVLGFYDGICDYPAQTLGNFDHITAQIDEFQSMIRYHATFPIKTIKNNFILFIISKV